MKKNLTWIALALALLVLFPALPQALAAIAAAVVVWVSTQPILVGFGIALIAMPHLRRTTKAPALTGH
ncbi:MAG: hypothetical protein HOZ81_10375 [Streptomyces sp.]|nr:hypothetical protein [Streptomyces sp.]